MRAENASRVDWGERSTLRLEIAPCQSTDFMRPLRLERRRLSRVEAEWQLLPCLLGLIEQPKRRQVVLCVLASRERRPLIVRMKSEPFVFRVDAFA